MLAIIPARGNSKGLKNKNILNLNGKPLISYSITEALKSKLISRVMVVTDSIKIAEISKKFGAEVPFIRPQHLAKDNSMIIDTYIYTLEFLKNKKQVYKEFVSLLPTSPLRTSYDIDESIKLFKKKKAKTLISITNLDKPVEWNLFLSKKSRIKKYLENNSAILNRQNYKPLFVPNGSIYIFNYSFLKKTREYYNNRTYGYFMPKSKSVDIDKDIDFKLAEILIKNNLKKIILK
jgi:N-acylneuraminate cytidylyltransferase/CMP-N,N'-diacetyllegionaminic acid synthase